MKKKKLVFYFFITKDWDKIIPNKIHFFMLQRYAHIFDEALFILSIDNVDDIETISGIRGRLASMPFKKIDFKIEKNNIDIRESNIFYKEVVDRITLDDDYFTFFGHSKGIGNICFPDLNSDNFDEEKNIYYWIIGLYYLSLEHIDDVLMKFSSIGYLQTLSYGSFLQINSDERFLYSGTFFWIFNARLKNYMIKNKIEFPVCSDRWSGEQFWTYISDNIFTFSSYKGRYINNPNYNFYKNENAIEALHMCLNDEIKIIDELYKEII